MGARTDVLKDGDRNTKFFHACAVVRRKRNRIEGLFDEAGIWHDNPSELRSMVVDHFKALFSEEGVRDGPIDLPRVLLCWVTQDFELYAAFDPLADKIYGLKLLVKSFRSKKVADGRPQIAKNCLCWVTQDFELYAAFDPLADKVLDLMMENDSSLLEM
ncbi:hypothetical protein V2J09_001310 [Rumex salicifolius]